MPACTIFRLNDESSAWLTGRWDPESTVSEERSVGSEDLEYGDALGGGSSDSRSMTGSLDPEDTAVQKTNKGSSRKAS